MKRYEFIDIGKGIGILLVVWAHILITGPSHQLIYAFHMPFFFFVSALLFNPRKFKSFGTFVIQRAKRLLIPYVLYSIITWCIWAIFRYIRGDAVDSYFMPLFQTFIAQGSGAFMVHNSALWFIPCLYVLEIAFYHISKLKTPVMLGICWIIALLGCMMARIWGNQYLLTLPWNLDAAIFALPFFGTAYAIREKLGLAELQNYIERNRIVAWIVVIVLWALMGVMAFCYGECSMGSSSYLCPMWVFYIRAFIGCFALTIFSILIARIDIAKSFTRGFEWFGQNSLDILCLHIPVKGVAIILVAKIFQPQIEVSSNAPLSALAFVMTMIELVPTVLVINKYFRKQDIVF